MFRAETASQELPVNYKTNLGNPSAFLKAGARITILSVLSRQVKNQTAILRNKENLRYIKDFPTTESKLQSDQNNNAKEPSMNSTKVLPLQCGKDSRTVIDGTTGVVEGDRSENEGSIGATNGLSESSGSGCSENGENNNGVFLEGSASSKNERVVSKNCVNGNGKYGREAKNRNMKSPFDYMKERKLSEPVMSPRKRTNVTIQKVARCSSTVDLRENEKPVLRELGGYKFFQKPNDVQESLTKKRTNSYRANENQTNDMMAMKKTIARQKENIANREKHVLQMEKKICVLESENSKSKKQAASLREKLKDSSCTMDYLRFEKEQLASEKDRLNFTILTHEHELKELRTQNVNLVNEYESAEQSRMIAVGHLQEMERTCQNSHQESGVSTNFKKQLSAESTSDALKNSEKFTAQLNSVK